MNFDLSEEQELFRATVERFTAPIDVEARRKLRMNDGGYDTARWQELAELGLIALAGSGVDFRLALLGARPRRKPEALLQLERELGERIVVNDRLERDAYEQTLATASIVVSTAIHEFQGLAVMEAVQAGCRPLVPDSLCYREQYPDAYRYLVESIERFPSQEALAALLREAGFASVRYRNVSFGIGCIHVAEAPD